MIQIKLRAWDGEEKRFLPIIEGHEYTFRMDKDGLYTEYECTPQENVTLQMCTGLLDKNGKEIYEGDIVADRSNTDLVFSIQYDTEHVGYYMPEAFDEECRFPISEVELEVIGNIYENPEFLTNNN